jgi:hypothetical protein
MGPGIRKSTKPKNLKPVGVVKGGAKAPRDGASGLATGKRAH